MGRVVSRLHPRSKRPAQRGPGRRQASPADPPEGHHPGPYPPGNPSPVALRSSETILSGCPMFAPAYVGRNRWGEAPTIAVKPAESNRRKSFSSHVRWCERGAPGQSCLNETAKGPGKRPGLSPLLNECLLRKGMNRRQSICFRLDGLRLGGKTLLRGRTAS